MTEELVYDGWHKIVLVEAEIKGQKVMREKLIINHAVSALVVDEKGRMGLVRQYRPTASNYLWEIPAGVLDKPKLSPVETLLEELEEECEIPYEDILDIRKKPIYSYFMMPGSSDAKMFIHHITVTEQTDKKVADVDVEEVRWFTKAQISDMIESCEIQDNKTMLTAEYFLNHC